MTSRVVIFVVFSASNRMRNLTMLPILHITSVIIITTASIRIGLSYTKKLSACNNYQSTNDKNHRDLHFKWESEERTAQDLGDMMDAGNDTRDNTSNSRQRTNENKGEMASTFMYKQTRAEDDQFKSETIYISHDGKSRGIPSVFELRRALLGQEQQFENRGNILMKCDEILLPFACSLILKGQEFCSHLLTNIKEDLNVVRICAERRKHITASICVRHLGLFRKHSDVFLLYKIQQRVQRFLEIFTHSTKRRKNKLKSKLMPFTRSKLSQSFKYNPNVYSFGHISFSKNTSVHPPQLKFLLPALHPSQRTRVNLSTIVSRSLDRIILLLFLFLIPQTTFESIFENNNLLIGRNSLFGGFSERLLKTDFYNMRTNNIKYSDYDLGYHDTYTKCFLETIIYVLIFFGFESSREECKSNVKKYAKLHSSNKYHIAPINFNSDQVQQNTKIKVKNSLITDLFFLPWQQEYTVCPINRFLPDAFDNSAQDMAYLGYRLATLSALPPSVPVSRVRLADAGFYFRGQADEVSCFRCQGRHSGWRVGDNPLDVHRRISPSCPHVLEIDRELSADTQQDQVAPHVAISTPLLNGHEAGDGPQGQSEDGVQSSQSPQHSEVTSYHAGARLNNAVSGMGSTSPGVSGCIFPRPNLELDQAVYPMYQDMASRKRSYPSWEESKAPPLDQMVMCGMYYAGYADCVRCFYCGVGLKSWEVTDDVWKEHIRWRPNCGYLRAVKGDVYLNRVLDQIRREADRDGHEERNPSRQSSNITTNGTPTQQSSNITTNGTPTQQSSNITTNGTPTQQSSNITTNGTPTQQSSNITTNGTPTQQSSNITTNGTPTQQTVPQSLCNNDVLQSQTTTSSASVPTSSTSDVASSAAQQTTTEHPLSITPSLQDGVTKTAFSQTTSANKLAKSTSIHPPSTCLTSTLPLSHNTPADVRPSSQESMAASGVRSTETADMESARHQDLLRENHELSRRSVCKMCHHSVINTIFLPCGHLVTCEACAATVTKCPLCDDAILGTARVHNG